MNPEKLAEKLKELEAKIAKSAEEIAELTKRNTSLTESAKEAGFEVDGDKIVKREVEEFVELDGEKIAKSSIPASVLAHLAKRDAEAAELRKKAEESDLLKRGDEIVPNMVGGDSAKIEIVKMLDGLTDDTVRKSMTEALKAADAVLKAKTAEMGSDVGNGGESGSEAEELDKKVEEYAKTNSVTKSEAYAAVLKTADGKRLAAAGMTKRKSK